MEQIMKSLVFLIFILHLSSAVSHSLQYFSTGVTPGINFPEYTMVGLVDGEQFVYYDSNSRRTVPKTEWIQKIDHDDADYWNSETLIQQGTQEVFKFDVQNLMQRFNQTKGVHTVQVMYGCELDDDGTKRGYMQDGFDGEDFISLDLKTLTWTAAVPQAVLTKHKLEEAAEAGFDVDYLKNECIEWLQKYVGYGRDTLERKVSPKVDLFQRGSSSPVVCHATGFFPRAVMISWQKNGEDLHEDVELRETVPNNDGTFQKRSLLTVPPEELKRNQYTCVVQHSSLEEDLVLKVSDGRVLSGGVSAGSGVLLVVGAVVAVLLLVIVGVGVVIWKKKKSYSKCDQRSSSESISSTDSVQSRRDSGQSSRDSEQSRRDSVQSRRHSGQSRRDSVQSTVSSTDGFLEDD